MVFERENIQNGDFASLAVFSLGNPSSIAFVNFYETEYNWTYMSFVAHQLGPMRRFFRKIHIECLFI